MENSNNATESDQIGSSSQSLEQLWPKRINGQGAHGWIIEFYLESYTILMAGPIGVPTTHDPMALVALDI